MHQKTKDIQAHYEGFINTHCLWASNNIYNLAQFEVEQTLHSFDIEIDSKLRLGKYVERLVSFQLSKSKHIQIVSENIQIQKDTLTLGELDCILLQNEQPIHLEIIYKFYVYDPSLHSNEIDGWIGPNRKDSLVEKLDKLQEKQLPLLYTDECKKYLQSLELETNTIQQKVYFKAQLFIPYQSEISFSIINKDCVAGFYIDLDDLHQFKQAKFYIPNKKDWLIIPHTNVSWISFEDFLIDSAPYLEREFSPMCWLKSNNGELQKFFLVWWKA
ncbi:MAG: DUF1853 family protein [Flavobacteriaceae bacterium]